MSGDEKLGGVIRMVLFAMEETPGSFHHRLFLENAKQALDAWLVGQLTSPAVSLSGVPTEPLEGTPEADDAD
jgi:hypothetical protein